jgi:hypothetical protein
MIERAARCPTLSDERVVVRYVMRAHKQSVTVAADHQIAIRLPDDFPSGPAEIIVLTGVAPSELLRPAVRALKPHPVLGKIVFHEDPSSPLDPEDWPES